MEGLLEKVKVTNDRELREWAGRQVTDLAEEVFGDDVCGEEKEKVDQHHRVLLDFRDCLVSW